MRTAVAGGLLAVLGLMGCRDTGRRPGPPSLGGGAAGADSPLSGSATAGGGDTGSASDLSGGASPGSTESGGGAGFAGAVLSAGGAVAHAAQPAANVRGVSVAGEEGSYTFSVSVESDDIDCSQFANFWEVLSSDGRLLYRRILEHSHTDENGTSDVDAPGNTFTRSGGPVPVMGAEVVIVRAHMNTGGYYGTAMRGSAAGGFAIAADLPAAFAAALEFEEPLSASCLF